MGVVWRARHPEGSEVAVKVLKPGVREASRLAMQREIVTMARLRHPHIVAVLDTGTVPEGLVDDDDELAAGAPWVAMELAEGGSLLDTYRTLRSAQIQRLLRQVLRALAYAHARGILHRDLKPSNILLGADGGARLVDFGLVLRLDGHDVDAPSGGGTPSYMAPEQADPDHGPMGPWTDLYSLGIVAWVLTTGRRPFEASDPADQVRNHRSAPLPPYVARRAVPEGFEHWLARLLAKHPHERFQRAGDALASLLALGPVRKRPLREMPAGPPLPIRRVSLARQPRPPLTPLPRRLPRGLSLLTLQEPPLVGRRAEQDQLWQALRQVHGEGTPRLMLLRGPTGVGRTRLAGWIGRTAHEIGAAQVLPIRPDTTAGALLRATLAPGAPPEANIRAWARRHGLTDDEERLLLATVADDPRGAPPEAVTALLLLLRNLCADRPVVLHVDDLPANPVGRPLIEALASGAEAVPVLAVVTVAEHDLVDDDDAEALWDDLRGLPIAEELSLAPLRRADGVQMLRSLVRLAPQLESQLATRTAGNPLFALEVVRSWAQSGRLKATPDGWTLRGAGIAMPSTVTEAARDRLERFLARRDDWSAALECAALLGTEIDSAEWQRVCGPVPADLMPALLVERLVIPSPAWRGLRWRFAHGMLGEVLRERAVRAGRLRRHHRAIAAALQAGGAGPDRLAPHLQGAGDALAAGRAWLEVAVRDLKELRVTDGLHAVDLADEQLALAGLGEDHPERLVAAIRRATALHMQGHDEDQHLLLASILARAERGTVAHREALLGLGTHAGWRGDAAGFRRHLQDAYALAREADDTHTMGRARERLARFESMAGEHARAQALVDELLATGWDAGIARRTAVVVAGRAGDLDGARAHADEGARWLAREGRFGGRAGLWNDLGSVLLQGGDAAGATDALERAERDARTAGSIHTLTYVLANSAMLATRSGNHTVAASRLAEAITLCRDPRLSALLSAVSLLPLASLRRWADVDHAAAEALTTVSLLGDDAAVWMVQRAVEVVERTGDAGRIARVRTVAEHLARLAHRPASPEGEASTR